MHHTFRFARLVTISLLLATICLGHTAWAANGDLEAAAEDPHDSQEEPGDEELVDDDHSKVEPLGKDDIEDLTQMRSRLSQASQQLSADVEGPLTPTAVLDRIGTPHTPERIFQWMAEYIEFEPYPGAMRGARGALVTGYANAVDQALLASAILEAAGHDVRFVTGSLHDADVQRIVEDARGTASVSTADGRATLDADQVEQPNLRPLLNAVEDHVWLEVDIQGTPRAFDPVAAPNYGITKAEAHERHDDLPAHFQTHFQMQMVSDLDDGRSLEHLVLEGPLPEVAFESMTLSFDDDPTRTRGFKPTLTVGDERVSGQTIPADAVERLELEFRFRTGRHEHRWHQVMYRKGQGVDVFDFDHQHFTIAVAPGPISDDRIRGLTAQSTSNAADALASWIDAESESDIDPDTRRDHVNATFDAFGSVFPFVFTRLLDRSSNELARHLGVRAVYTSPRVITAGLLRDGHQFHLDVQIDGDRIRAIPRAGIPPMAATAFLGLYGIIRDELTSDILDAYGDHDDTTVRKIFRLVTEQSPRVTTIYSANIAELDDLDVGENTRDAMRHQIRQRDMVLLTPTAPVDDDGIERFGWWALTPHRGNIEGHTTDALLTAEDRAEKAPVDARQLIEAHLVLLARHYQAAEHATASQMRFPERACSANSVYRELSRVFCAQSEPLAPKELSRCFQDADESDSEGGGGLLAFTEIDCTDLVAPTRCGASYASSVLGGELGVADETTSAPRTGLCR